MEVKKKRPFIDATVPEGLVTAKIGVVFPALSGQTTNLSQQLNMGREMKTIRVFFTEA